METLPNLRIQLAPRHSKGLLMENPVMVAAGTFGYGTEHNGLVDIQELGAIVCKGITLMPRKGNPQPRVVETTSGLLNSVGLENIGVDALIEDKASVWAGWRVPVIVNVGGGTFDEYIQVASKLEGIAGVSGIELNISCPNILGGGMEFGVNPKLAAELTSAVKTASSLPLIVKLSPNVTDIVEIALAVEGAGTDAISLINTVKGMAIDISERRPCLGSTIGGLSGPAIKPIALYAVYEVTKDIHIPVIGCGGVSCARDALEFIMAGASAVQIGTANLTNPGVSLAILQGIKDFMKQEGIEDLTRLVGVAH